MHRSDHMDNVTLLSIEVNKLKNLVEQAEDYIAGLADIVIRYRDYLQNTEVILKKLSLLVEALTKDSVKILDSIAELLPSALKGDLENLLVRLTKLESTTSRLDDIIPKPQLIQDGINEIKINLIDEGGPLLKKLARLEKLPLIEDEIGKLHGSFTEVKLSDDVKYQKMFNAIQNGLHNLDTKLETLARKEDYPIQSVTTTLEKFRRSKKKVYEIDEKETITLRHQLRNIEKEFTALKKSIANFNKNVKSAKPTNLLEKLRHTVSKLKARNKLLQQRLRTANRKLAARRSAVSSARTRLNQRVIKSKTYKARRKKDRIASQKPLTIHSKHKKTKQRRTFPKTERKLSSRVKR